LKIAVTAGGLDHNMPKKKRKSAHQVADELAEIALRHLKAFSEEEQEKRISAAERLVATALSAGSPRTSLLNSRNRRSRVSVRAR
jgi:hypothetical protein